MTANLRRRKLFSRIFEVLCGLTVVVALIPLAMILFYVIKEGAGALNLDFFTKMPKPVGESGGGMANAIVGTLILIGIAALVGVPIGCLCGIHLAEYPGRKFSSIVRFAADVLNGVPSIVIGIFAYGLVVLPVKRFSAIAGGVALGLLMIPIVVRTTEELIRLVPGGLREGALALGATRSRAVFGVIVPAALPGILTGILVALARVAGETAPLLFTALSNRFWSTSLTQPIASLTVQVYTYAQSPYDDWHRQAWAGAFLLVMMILTLSIAARLAVRRLERMNRS
ncbi:MAG TPA: phosphate ABC transporter permease PstA [Thermoanaerobaculia bacterium]|nr:phosphate ABC transporter permease PstA [Thermoanaerobaculia bacterium]